MIGAVGNQTGAMPGAEVRGVGKRPDAVGQQAKVAVSLAREAGQSLPPNAQGLAASAIARGIDPATLFASRVSESDLPVEVPGDEAPNVGDATEPENDEMVAVDEDDVAAVLVDKEEISEGYDDIVISEDPSTALLLDVLEQDVAAG